MTRTSTTKDMTDETRAETAEVVSPSTPEEEVMQKLDVIIGYMHAMNRRDRMRYYGGLVHSLIALIPMILFLFSAWYIYQNGEKLLTQIVGETVRQTTTMSTNSMDELFRTLMPGGTTPPPAVIR